MTKVYLVYAQGCHSNGRLDSDSKTYVRAVFSNKKLALKCADYYNQEWEYGIKRNADFKKEKILFYFVVTKIIVRQDYSKMAF